MITRTATVIAARVAALSTRIRLAPCSRYILPIGFAFALTVIYLSSILSAGSSDGDVALGALRGIAGFEGLDPLAVIKLVAHQSSVERGGWFPLRAIEPAFWYVFPSPVVGRVLALAIVGANVATFTALVAIVTRSARTCTLAGVGTVLALELRKPHDVVLSGTYGLPIAFQMSLLALCAYGLFIESNKVRYFVAAIVIEAAACAADETALLLAFAFPLLDLVRPRRIGPGLFFLFFPALSLAVTLALHLHAPASLRWLSDGSLADVKVALQQCVAVLPTSYRAFDNVVRDGVPAYFYDARYDAILGIDAAGTIAALAASIAVFYVASRRGDVRDKRREHLVPALLAVLFLLAAALVHDPLDWRRGLPMGEAFPSVYVGYFGFGLLSALAVRALAGVRPQSLQAVLPIGSSLAVFAIVYGNARVNERVVAINRNAFETVNLIQAAGNAGLFEALPPEVSLVLDRDTPLPGAMIGSLRDPKYLFYLASGRRFAVVETRNADRIKDHRLWVVHRERTGVLAGGLTVAPVEHVREGAYFVDVALAYHHYPTAMVRDGFLADFRQPARGIRYLQARRPGADLVARIRRTCGPVAVDRVYVPNDPAVEFADGFFRASMYKRWGFWATNFFTGSDVASEQHWRYGAEASRLVVRNAGCRPDPIRLQALAYAAAPGKLSIAAPGFHKTLSIDAAGMQLDIVIPPTSRERFDVDFTTQAPPAQEDLGFPHFRSDERGPARLILANPWVAVAKASSKND